MINDAVATAKSELVGTDADGASVDTIKGAKKYADEKAAAINGTIEENERVTTEALNDLDARVTALDTNKANAADVYTKTETETAITTKINDLDFAKVTGIVRSVEQVDGKVKAEVGTVSYTELTDKPIALTNAEIEAIVNGTQA